MRRHKRMLGDGLAAAICLVMLGTTPGWGRPSEDPNEPDTQNVTKQIAITWKPADGAKLPEGKVTFGENYAWDKRFPGPGKKDTEGPYPFVVRRDDAAHHDSYVGRRKARVQHGGSRAATTIIVGPAKTAPEGRLSVAGEITLHRTVALRGGTVTGRGKIDLQGDVTYAGLRVFGVDIDIGDIPGKLQELEKKGLFLDPVSIALRGKTYGETLVADVFDYRLESGFGANAGMNDDDRLELSNDPATGGMALFESQTLVDWATDYTGMAKLENGAFTVEGIFMPPSGEVTDWWDLVEVGRGFVQCATLKPEFLPSFALTMYPPVETEDTFDMQLSMDAYSQLSTVPEPASLVLLASGGLCALRRRRFRCG